jgi:tetratricopeptide (TPR) repeat protein
MYSLVIAVITGFIFIFLPPLLGLFGYSWSVLPGIFVGIGCFVILNRRFAKKVEALVHLANESVQAAQSLGQRGGGQKGSNKLMIEKKIEYAVEILKQGFQYEKWQVGASVSLNAQIGMILFSQYIFTQKGKKGRVSDAIPYLENSMVNGAPAKLMQGLWHSWIRLAVCYFLIEQDFEKTKETMEKIVKVAHKEGFIWAVYAWFYVKTNKTDEALEVLVRGVEKAPSDSKLAELYDALRNGKKLKMGTVYGNQWWGLGLEKPKHMNPNAQMKGRSMRR